MIGILLALAGLGAALAVPLRPGESGVVFWLDSGSLRGVRYLPRMKEFTNPITFGEDATAYSVDEVHHRLVWRSSNGNLFVKYIYVEQPFPTIIVHVPRNDSVVYDAAVGRLYLTDDDRKIDCLTDFRTKQFGGWIDEAIYEKDFALGIDERFGKIVHDTDVGVVFALLEVDGAKNVYRFNMGGANEIVTKKTIKTLFIPNLNNDEFDVDEGTKKLFWIDGKTIKSTDYDGNGETLVLQVDYEIISFSINNNRLFWTTYDEANHQSIIATCTLQAAGKCPPDDIITSALPSASAFRNLGTYHKLMEHKFLTPCASQADCVDSCLLDKCWPFQGCECRAGQCASPGSRHRRQSPPFDMYNEQPTLRPEPVPTPPDVAYLPVYLYSKK